MISYIKGEIAKKGLDYIIIDNNNMGYYISTSFSTLNKLKEKDHAMILTYMHVREDIVALFGFLTQDEMDLFKKLITVNGIGPKAGLAVLSTYETNTIKEIILKEDANRMSKVPGIGKKTASKIILELKDKVGTLDSLTVGESETVTGRDTSDILDALISLGFNSNDAKNALDSMDIEGKSENDIIKEALKNITRQVL
ncbi:Holliday junction branch migration protein RuvA [Sedimentibacter saalensis]|jgi:Holliday junction DNA helicase RuvA|uniref:Holliday junction branch migration complex subunit RuvA n=2 Tax=root TaxID=1 RepID=A0A562J9C4_9FIRM|nr:Holliday junction branch migration protein RuvA [Sedimentibacter saalensis]MEA5095724.1 Holliday junction branch migration protein RuvA [Sedimentibacter saalensis]TWH79781.1 Holliday junction DNA helicase subunit RuvA [Sedimentibacter saalensis]